MSSPVSEDEFRALHQQLMDLKMKHYEVLEREKKVNNGKLLHFSRYFHYFDFLQFLIILFLH
jgi:hypothetical protein